MSKLVDNTFLWLEKLNFFFFLFASVEQDTPPFICAMNNNTGHMNFIFFFISLFLGIAVLHNGCSCECKLWAHLIHGGCFPDSDTSLCTFSLSWATLGVRGSRSAKIFFLFAGRFCCLLNVWNKGQLSSGFPALLFFSGEEPFSSTKRSNQRRSSCLLVHRNFQAFTMLSQSYCSPFCQESCGKFDLKSALCGEAFALRHNQIWHCTFLKWSGLLGKFRTWKPLSKLRAASEVWEEITHTRTHAWQR